MSERKTSEIKLRVTPSFKAAVQLAAETAGETMSVYIEKASQDRMTFHQIGEDLKLLDRSVATDDGDLAALFNPPVAQNPVPAKSDKVACEKNCSPWQWCECKAELGG